jgi:hypothetical protein
MTDDLDVICDVDISAIGEWLHNPPSSPEETVREFAGHPDFWEHRFDQPSREELTRLIAVAREIARIYCLVARPESSGKVRLVKGCHRWAVAHELGFQTAPVRFEPEQQDAWPDSLSMI